MVEKVETLAPLAAGRIPKNITYPKKQYIMKIRKGLFLHTIGDECIVMQDGSSNVDFSNILNLNPTAVFLWQAIGEEDFDDERIARMLTEHYEVSEEQARRDARAFIGMLKEAQVIEE